MKLLLDTHALLPIPFAHTALLATMPFHHRDPFDRLIVAQACAERMDVLSADEVFDQYDIARRR